MTSSTACARFFALVAARPSFSSVSTRASAPVGSAILPVYNALGGPQGNGHVTFNRTNSQYLDAGPRTLNIATNGGLTIVSVVRFTGDPGFWERIIDLGSGGPDNNIILTRWETTSDLALQVNTGTNDNGQINVRCDGVIVQGTWMTVVLRYNAAMRTFVIKVIATLATTDLALKDYQAPQAVTDRTVSGTWIAKNHYEQGTNSYFNGDIAGVFVVDEYLSTDATSAIADAMVRGMDLTQQACLRNSTTCGTSTQCPAAISSVNDMMLSDMKTGFTV